MRISGSTPQLPPVASQAGAPHRSEADAQAQAPAPATSETEAPTESGKPHGLVRAAEHSHRSDVAALRQWINHPDLRSDLTLPDLSTERNGNGFAKAVAAYEAAIASATPAPATDPAPVVTDPTPVVDPAPVVVGSTPAEVEPDPVVVVPPTVAAETDPLLDVLLPESPPTVEA